MNKFGLVGCGVAALASTGCSLITATSTAEDKKPNIILVMADDQGYGDCGYTGHPFVLTPNLDAMAKDSVVFNQFYAGSPVCSPTRASVLTGRTAMRTNILNHGHYMRPHEKTLAEGLKEAGYVTGHFGKWHIGSIQPESPTAPGKIGFDESLTGINFFDIDPYLAENGVVKQFKGQGTEIVTDATIEFLKKHKDGDKPMFAVTWFPAPHDPHKEVPVAFEGSADLYKDEGHYRGYFLEITLLDQQVGRLRKALRDMDIADNTIVWYCSDNGGLDKRSSGGRAKKGAVYEGGLRIPSLLEWPAKLSHKEIDVPAVTSDMYPTLMKIAGAKVMHQPRLDGIDLWKVIEGRQSTRPAIGFWHKFTGGQPCWSDIIMKDVMEFQQGKVKENKWASRIMKTVDQFPKYDKTKFPGHAAWNKWPYKVHHYTHPKTGKVKVELYNLEKDPMEANDLSGKEKELTAKMLKELKAWQVSVLESMEGKDYETLEIK